MNAENKLNLQNTVSDKYKENQQEKKIKFKSSNQEDDKITQKQNDSKSKENLDLLVSYLEYYAPIDKNETKLDDEKIIEPFVTGNLLLTDYNELKIKEEGYHLTNSKLKSELIITIPDTNLNEIDINTGAGNLNIDSINTEKLDIDLGTGTTLINNLYSKRADIDTGAGTFTINNGSINDLDLDIGVGEVKITSNITGNSSISSGVGKLSLNLLNTFDNYRFEVNKGIGKVTINDIEVGDNSTLGNGTNTIKLDGGIGEIVVKFKK